MRDSLEDNGYEETSYRKYELWKGHGLGMALLEQGEGGLIVEGLENSTEGVLTNLYNGSGSLADAKDSDLKRILDKLGDAPFVIASVADDGSEGDLSCTVRRCQGWGLAMTGYDSGKEALAGDIAFLFSSERAAEDAADEDGEFAEVLAFHNSLDADITINGEFILISSSR